MAKTKQPARPEGSPPPVGVVGAEKSRADELVSLLGGLRDAASAVEAAAKSLSDEDALAVARRLFPSPGDPAGSVDQYLLDCAVSVRRLKPMLLQLAGRALLAQAGPGNVVPFALPESAVVRFMPNWAPVEGVGNGWLAVWYDRAPAAVCTAIPLGECATIDGRPAVVLGVWGRTVYPLADAVRYTRQSRAFDDERDRQARGDAERERLQAESEKKMRQAMLLLNG